MKDPSIRDLLASLKLEARSRVVRDWWDGDLCAIGIARQQDPRRLVYVSTWRMAPGRYYYECEVPVGPEETDYEVTEVGEDVDLHRLLSVMVRHLTP